MTTEIMSSNALPTVTSLAAGDEVEVPAYGEAYSLTLVLNTDAFPILSEEPVKAQVERMIEDYTTRINGYRSLAEQRAALEISRQEALDRQHEAERELDRRKSKLLLELAEEVDPKGKPKYGAEYKVKAAVDVRVNEVPDLAKMDEVVFRSRMDVRGLTAKIEAVKQHMSATREEIVASRDMLSHLVNSGLIAVAGPMEGYDEAEGMGDVEEPANGS